MKRAPATIRDMPTAAGSMADEFRIRSGAIETFDPVELARIVPQTTIEHTLLETGHFKGAWLRAQLGRCHLATVAFNRSLLATGRMPLGFGVLLDAAETSSINGHELRPGDMVVFGEDNDVYFQLASRTHWCFLRIQRETLKSLGVRVEPSTVKVLALAPGQRRGLERAARGTIEMLGQFQAGLSDVSSRRPALVEDLRYGLLTAFIRSLEDWQRPSNARPLCSDTYAERYALVREAESLMMTSLEETLSISQICAHLDITVRRIELAFDDVHGVSPKRFQTLRRLAALRHKLLCPPPDRRSVTEIALACGFTHLGRVSSIYKDAFDELPSETLTRRLAGMASAMTIPNGDASPQTSVN